MEKVMKRIFHATSYLIALLFSHLEGLLKHRYTDLCCFFVLDGFQNRL